MVRITFFPPDEVPTLSKADKDAATAGKLLVEGASASASWAGHSVVNTDADETRTGSSREVVVRDIEGGVVREGVVI